MRPNLVVMLAPSINRSASVIEMREPVLIEAGVSKLAVETLNERILCRLAGLNEMQRYARALRSQEHGFAGKFAAVIVDQGSR